MIYLDHAATSIYMPERAKEAMLEALSSFGNAGRGAGEPAMKALRGVYEARETLTSYFGGNDPSRLVFTSGGTQALNMAIFGTLETGDHVITTSMEHNSVLRPLYAMEEKGVELTILDADEKGRLPVDSYLDAVKDNTKAIITAHMFNVTGNIQDLAAIGRLCREKGILFIVDACQSAGELPIDVEEMDIDILCFTGHKALLGPQGIGGLYVREGVEVRPLVTGGTGAYSFLKKQPDAYPEHLEAGTLNGPGIAALAAAVKEIQGKGTAAIQRMEAELTKNFYEKVSRISGVRIYGDFEGVHGPIVSLNIRDMDASEVSDWLYEEYGIVTRAGAHCAPLVHEAFDTRTQGMVRFSFSWTNTREEVRRAAEAVRNIAGMTEMR